MRKTIQKAFVLLLALCMTVSLVPMSASAAVSGQDAYYLARLKPNPMPKAQESYPAKLLVKVNIPNMMNADLEFKGTVGVNAELTDEEIVAILKQAVSAVKSYTSPQSACDDLTLVEELTEKLKFSKEDMDEILNNWKKLLGVDMVADILSGKIPTIDAADAVNAIIDMVEGKIPANPKPSMPGWGTVIDGVFISFEEYQKDQQKYKDIIALSQANERLSAYNSRVRGLIRDKMKEKGGWRLEISAQDIADLTYNKMPGSKQLWTANIDLKKDDSELTSISGNYSGVFTLKMDADMSAYDDGYDDWYAKELSKGGLAHSPTGNTGDPTEIKLSYEIPNCRLNISLPEGKNRHFFEENIPNTALAQTEFTINSNRTVAVKDASIDSTTVWHVEENNGYYKQQLTVTTFGKTVVQPADENMMAWPPNTTGNVTMTLVIDMLGK